LFCCWGDACREALFHYKCIPSLEWDKKRLSYLLYLVEEDILMAKKYYNKLASLDIPHSQGKIGVTPHLRDLLEVRLMPGMKEKMNMLLLLIIAGLEFEIPIDVMRTTIEVITLEILE